MLHFDTILHPTDFSPHSEHAWHLACCLARDHGARLMLAHVRPQSTLLYSAASVPADLRCEAHIREQLQEVAPGDPRLKVDRFLLDGDPGDALLEFLDEHPTDLIVMGSHGRTGISRLVMGSVAEELVRRAPCPVLIVKQPVPETCREPEDLLEPVIV